MQFAEAFVMVMFGGESSTGNLKLTKNSDLRVLCLTSSKPLFALSVLCFLNHYHLYKLSRVKRTPETPVRFPVLVSQINW
jgi:hypothetical protein